MQVAPRGLPSARQVLGTRAVPWDGPSRGPFHQPTPDFVKGWLRPTEGKPQEHTASGREPATEPALCRGVFGGTAQTARHAGPTCPAPFSLEAMRTSRLHFRYSSWVPFAWWLAKFKRSGLGWAAVKKTGWVLSLKRCAGGRLDFYFYFPE